MDEVAYDVGQELVKNDGELVVLFPHGVHKGAI